MLHLRGAPALSASRLEALAQKREVEERAQALAISVAGSMETAIEQATRKGEFETYRWFPENSDVMREVLAIISKDFTALGYGISGQVVDDHRHHRYSINLSWR